MNENELLFGFFIGLIIVAAGTVLLSVLQWRRIDRESNTQRAMKTLRGKSQPSVTVLVYARNCQGHIVATLRSLKNNRYRGFDIVVVDDASDDQTAMLVKAFCEKYPKAPIKLLKRRRQTSPNQALQAGYQKSQRGSVIVTVQPGIEIDSLFVKRAVASRDNRNTWRVATPRTLGPQLSIADIGAFLERYFWHQTDEAQVYDAVYFKARKPATALTNAYADGVTAAASLLCFAFLLIATFLVLGVQALWYAWVIVTAYGLVIVWLRYGEPLHDRLVLSLSIPLALFLIPATGAVRGISQLSSRK